MRPLISAVIPTYNRVDLIGRAIASVQSQTLPVSQIIVVDDGSTDDTLSKLHCISAEDDRLLVVEADHGGANRARNAGIAKATGTWVAFLDSDDFWKADKLERQMYEVSLCDGAVASFCGMTMIVDGQTTRSFIPKADPTLFDLRCCNVLSSTSTAIVRTDVLRKVGCFDPVLPSCQDWDLWFRLRKCGPFSVVQEELVFIDDGSHQRITRQKTSVLEGHKIMFARTVQDLPEGKTKSRVEAMHRLVQADYAGYTGRHRDALVHAWESCRRAPTAWGARLLAQSTLGAARGALSQWAAAFR